MHWDRVGGETERQAPAADGRESFATKACLQVLGNKRGDVSGGSGGRGHARPVLRTLRGAWCVVRVADSAWWRGAFRSVAGAAQGGATDSTQRDWTLKDGRSSLSPAGVSNVAPIGRVA